MKGAGLSFAEVNEVVLSAHMCFMSGCALQKGNTLKLLLKYGVQDPVLHLLGVEKVHLWPLVFPFLGARRHISFVPKGHGFGIWWFCPSKTGFRAIVVMVITVLCISTNTAQPC